MEFWRGKSEGKTPVGIHRRRWEDNIKTDIREREWGDVDYIHMAQDRDK
jgi:hypothetical protein